MALVREVPGAFDDFQVRGISELSTFDDCLEFVVWIFVAGDDDGLTSKMSESFMRVAIIGLKFISHLSIELGLA